MPPRGALRGPAGPVLFEDDPYDPDPPARAAASAAAMRAHDAPALVVFHPPAPTGHGGVWDPAFDARIGACLAGLFAGDAGARCGGAPAGSG